MGLSEIRSFLSNQMENNCGNDLEDFSFLEMSSHIKYQINGHLEQLSGYAVLNNQSFYLFDDSTRQGVVTSFQLTPDTKCLNLQFCKEPSFSLLVPAHPCIQFTLKTQRECTKWVNCINSSLPTQPSITMDSFDIISVLGRGYWGKVMLCRKKDTKALYAIKSLHKDHLIQTQKARTVMAERNILLRTQNPFIIHLDFAFQTASKFYLGLEYGAGGELFYLMQRVGSLPLELVRLYLAEIAIALNYLHSMGIVYRDLKPENLLLDAEGHIKLTDFGLSKELFRGTTSTMCGTVQYMSPEMVLGKDYDFSIDWWALGILCYEMLCDGPPFVGSNDNDIMEAIVNSDPFFPAHFPPDAQKFVEDMLAKDPKARPGFAEIKKMPFFAIFDWDRVYKKEYKPTYIPGDEIDYLTPEDVFSPEFTTETPIDSFVNPIGNIPGFSFTRFPHIQSIGAS